MVDLWREGAEPWRESMGGRFLPVCPALGTSHPSAVETWTADACTPVVLAGLTAAPDCPTVLHCQPESPG